MKISGRRQISRFIWIIFFVLQMYACGSNTATEKKIDHKNNISTSVFRLKDKGWDIYNGGAYRYGPSIILNDNGTIDAWFAAPGDFYGAWNYLYDKSGNSQAIPVSTNGSVGQKFTVDKPFWGVKVISPNWNGKPCGLTFRLFKWDNNQMSYSEVVKLPPVASAKFKDYADGEKIGVTKEDKFPAGTYLWEVSESLSDHSGVWLTEGYIPGVVSYQDGIPVSGNKHWQAVWTENKTSGDLFWDQASYQTSSDGGKTWSEEIMSLRPTEFTSDHYSVCDPGVAYWNGYYYIGYTSTENPAMTQNNVYVARGKSPTGPWEKWDGDGWGTQSMPVIRYDGNPNKFGAGEPSIVVLDNTIYFYYSWNDEGVTTRVATASADDPDWPRNLIFHGVAMDKSNIAGSDHSDVKYRKDIGKFQAIHTASRMTKEGYIVLWQSDDGLTFKKITEIHDNVMPGIHNCGWSGNEQGHIDPTKKQYLSYAYGIETWGVWNTRWVEIIWE